MRQVRTPRADELVEALARQRTEEGSKGTDERGVRQPGIAQLQTVAGQDVGTGGACLLRELGHEPRLADPGIAGHEAHRRHASGRDRQGGVQALELGASPNEGRTAHAGHVGDHTHEGPLR